MACVVAEGDGAVAEDLVADVVVGLRDMVVVVMGKAMEVLAVVSINYYYKFRPY